MSQDIPIPPRHRKAFERFLNLPAKAREDLISELARKPPVLDFKDLVLRVASSSELPNSDAESVVLLFLSVYRSGILEESSVDDFVAGLSSAISEDPDLKLPEEDAEEIIEQLVRAFSLRDSFGVTAKAHGVLKERERSVCTTRVITDVRPVFTDDPTVPPATNLIVHTLRITYHAEEELKEFFVQVNKSEIQHLLKALQRALHKEQTLEGLLDQTGLAGCMHRDSHA